MSRLTNSQILRPSLAQCVTFMHEADFAQSRAGRTSEAGWAAAPPVFEKFISAQKALQITLR